MPEYLYQHPTTNKIISIYQSVHDLHEYIDKKNIKWNRCFTSPQINADQKLNENSSSKDFENFTKDKKYSVGDLWDKSRELSEKRQDRLGVDKVKKEYYKNWSKQRKGKKHPKDVS